MSELDGSENPRVVPSSTGATATETFAAAAAMLTKVVCEDVCQILTSSPSVALWIIMYDGLNHRWMFWSAVVPAYVKTAKLRGRLTKIVAAAMCSRYLNSMM